MSTNPQATDTPTDIHGCTPDCDAGSHAPVIPSSRWEPRFDVEVIITGKAGVSTKAFKHDSEMLAMARVVSLLVKFPSAELTEKRHHDMDQPLQLTVTVKLPKGATL